MNSVLDTIVATKKREIASLPYITPVRASGPSFIEAILQKRPALIAEIKPMSPSEGRLLTRENVQRMVEIYNAHAQVISVLCDAQYFGGGFDLLKDVRAMTQKPLLAKEFILSSRQINHAAQNGAQAVLLIAAILTSEELQELAQYAIDLRLDVLLEIHDEEDFEKTGKAFDGLSHEERKHVVLGINNRNLRTLKTDIRTSERIAPLIKKLMPNVPLLTESGISRRGDVERLEPLVDGFLIGTSILQAKDPVACLTTLFPS